MGSVMSCLFHDLNALYQTALPPPQTPDDHKVHQWWYYGTGLYFVVLSTMQLLFGLGFANVLLFPLVFLTAFCFRRKWMKSCSDATPPETRLNPNESRYGDLVRTFFQGFWTGSAAAIIVETVLSVILALLIGLSPKSHAFMSSDQDMSKHTHNPLVHVYTFLNAFLVAGFTEEMTKGYLLQSSCKKYLNHTRYLDHSQIRVIVWMGLACGLGFGTAEGVLYTCVYGINAGIIGQIFLWIVRVTLAIPFHSVLGFMWGLQWSRKVCLKQQISWIEVSWRQILLHGLYDYGVMTYSLFESRAGILLQLLGLVLGFAVLFVSVWVARMQYFRVVRSSVNPSSTGSGSFIPLDSVADDHSVVVDGAEQLQRLQ